MFVGWRIWRWNQTGDSHLSVGKISDRLYLYMVNIHPMCFPFWVWLICWIKSFVFIWVPWWFFRRWWEIIILIRSLHPTILFTDSFNVALFMNNYHRDESSKISFFYTSKFYFDNHIYSHETLTEYNTRSHNIIKHCIPLFVQIHVKFYFGP